MNTVESKIYKILKNNDITSYTMNRDYNDDFESKQEFAHTIRKEVPFDELIDTFWELRQVLMEIVKVMKEEVNTNAKI